MWPLLFIAALLFVVVLAVRSERVRAFLIANGSPPRLITAASALLLAGLGLFFLRVLVADSGDNAYLWLALMGFVLIGLSIPFVLATITPDSAARRMLALLGVALVLVIGALNIAVLIQALAIIPSQNYSSSQVLVSHLVGLFTLIPALLAIWAGHRFVRAH